jgi:hypothetical protein
MIEELRLHIGAHKTATTDLQDNLAAQSGIILQGGLVYLSRGFVRKSGLLRGMHDNYRRLALGRSGFRSLDEVVVLPEGHPRRLLISEENILGLSTDLLEGLYPRARTQLEPWAAALGSTRLQIYLSIRNYAEILPSAYSQALRDGAVPHAMTSYRTHWLGRKPSWIDLIKAIQAVFGATPLTVWSIDFYAHSASAVRKALTGLDLPGQSASRSDETRRLTADAVRRIEDLGRSLSGPARAQAIHNIVTSDTSRILFDPLPAEEKAFHSERYSKDIEVIKKMPLQYLG